MTRKEHNQRIAQAVAALLAKGVSRADIVRQVAAQTGCHASTVYSHLRRPDASAQSWGGRRPGAGYPKGKPWPKERRLRQTKSKRLTDIVI